MSDDSGRGARSPANAPLVAVVDDDASVLRSLRSLLRSSGLRVQTFGSGPAFLDYPELAATRCLVLDLNMPEMSGSELISHLSMTRRLMPFVVLTAAMDGELAGQMMRRGAVACLRKPPSGLELRVAIQTALQDENGK